MKSKKYFLLFLIIIFISCKKPLEIDKDFTQTKPVLNCYFSPQDSLVISLTQSRSPLSNYDLEFEILKNVEIKLYENNIFKEITLDFDGTYYIAHDFIFKRNCVYKIEIITEKGEFITALDSITNFTEINYFANHEIFVEDINENLLRYEEVIVNFSNPINEKNYYWLDFKQFMKPENSDDWLETSGNTISNDFILGNWDENKFSFIVFSDDIFDGLDYGLSLKFYKIDSVYFWKENRIERIDSFKVVFKLNSISENLYKFMNSYNEQTKPGAEINNPLEEPEFIFCNVTGGYGIFGAYNTYIDSFAYDN